jgi:hypothetical protein
VLYSFIVAVIFGTRRSQSPPGLRSAAARLLRSWVLIPPGAWMFIYCECCVLSGRGLCDELITHPEESYRLWCVVVCDLETSRMRRPWPALGRSATGGGESLVLNDTNRMWQWLSETLCRCEAVERRIFQSGRMRESAVSIQQNELQFDFHSPFTVFGL